MFKIIIITLVSEILSEIVYNEDKWGGICNTGKLQSPINIETVYNFVEDTDYIAIVSREYENINKPFSFKKNATISIDYDKKSSLDVRINGINYMYVLKEIQLHAPSEHTINGNQTDLELLLIHEKDTSKNSTDQKTDILIISFLYKASATIDNALVSEWKFSGNSNINITKYFKPEKGLYHYVGSLTTDPCTENVNWIVMEEFNYMSLSQFQYLKSNISKYFSNGNSRSVKPIRSRNIYYRPHSRISGSYALYSILNIIILFILI